MSFGFGVGDFIAGANLAHKLIRVMTETRGASAEFQEALAEVCGIQQILIQLTQLCRSEVLPRATLNSIAQIVMPSMTTIADFLDRTKHYQEKLSPRGGLSGSWCKMGWALFRKDELKLLRDTLHSRLSSINTLLAAANHLPSPAGNIGQYQVQEEDQESKLEVKDYPNHSSANYTEYVNMQENISDLYEQKRTAVQSLVRNSDDEGNKLEINVQTLPSSGMEWLEGIEDTSLDIQTPSEAINLVNGVVGSPGRIEGLNAPLKPTPKRPSRQEVSFATRNNGNVQSSITSQTPQGLKEHNPTTGDLGSYLQMLFEKALVVQAEAEAKAAAEMKAAEDAEWKQRMEEVIRIQAEIDIRKKLDSSRIEAENKACIRFKDAVGRKFNFPYDICSTWQGMEELIKHAFMHVNEIGPHVQAGHYDLEGPSGEIILPQAWSKAIQPDWAITMKMWPMNKPSGPPLRPFQGMPTGLHLGMPRTGPNQGMGLAVPRPGVGRGIPQVVQVIPTSNMRPGGRVGIRPRKIYELPSSDDDTESEDDKKFSFKTYLGRKLKRIRGKKSSKGSDESSSGSDD
ncbi:uncharacterized protein GGS22DRAFT_88928 [Annulohypoxylon maeteangense]|uniref:uncharacterized protein n=1 Tax=Annulohypoxylon maeteangense TaxID=1927788 RepID=UPI002008E89A|nr:uncharacterized protein GGS22DRAFT_88928 [Annulohypoxylon maeteangense]KAI0887769.1 hypothetical protein GGS22DRAFT_88928 [Annulohypoxylon maeteangense]